jgi:hypothetical protein
MIHSARSNLLCDCPSSGPCPQRSKLRVAGLGIGADPQAGLSCDVQTCWFREALGRLSLSRTLRLRFSSRKNALMSFNQEFMRRKGEETFQSPLLASTFTKSMKASNLNTKPNCIVYIIQLQ